MKSHTDNFGGLSFSDNYGGLLAELHDGNITYMEFLDKAGSGDKFREWCKSHHVAADEGGAQLYFDMLGFEETADVKQVLQPIY